MHLHECALLPGPCVLCEDPSGTHAVSLFRGSWRYRVHNPGPPPFLSGGWFLMRCDERLEMETHFCEAERGVI